MTQIDLQHKSPSLQVILSKDIIASFQTTPIAQFYRFKSERRSMDLRVEMGM